MQFKYLFTALPLLLTTATAQLASVTWPSNLGHIRVYRVADNGRIQEYQWDSTGQWTGPSWIGAKAKPGSALTAVNSNDRLRVYYIDGNDKPREHMYEPGQGWSVGQF